MSSSSGYTVQFFSVCIPFCTLLVSVVFCRLFKHKQPRTSNLLETLTDRLLGAPRSNEPTSNFESARAPDGPPVPWSGTDPAYSAGQNYYVPTGHPAVTAVTKQPPATPVGTTSTTTIQYLSYPAPYHYATAPAYYAIVPQPQAVAPPPPPPPPPPTPKEIVKSVGVGLATSASVEVITVNNSSRDIIEKFYMYAPSPLHASQMVAKFAGDGYTCGEWQRADTKDPNYAYYITLTKVREDSSLNSLILALTFLF